MSCSTVHGGVRDQVGSSSSSFSGVPEAADPGSGNVEGCRGSGWDVQIA